MRLGPAHQITWLVHQWEADHVTTPPKVTRNLCPTHTLLIINQKILYVLEHIWIQFHIQLKIHIQIWNNILIDTCWYSKETFQLFEAYMHFFKYQKVNYGAFNNADATSLCGVVVECSIHVRETRVRILPRQIYFFTVLFLSHSI